MEESRRIGRRVNYRKGSNYRQNWWGRITPTRRGIESKSKLIHHISKTKSNIPIYFDRLLTDEDFKRIRALKRKKEIEEEKLKET